MSDNNNNDDSNILDLQDWGEVAASSSGSSQDYLDTIPFNFLGNVPRYQGGTPTEEYMDKFKVYYNMALEVLYPDGVFPPNETPQTLLRENVLYRFLLKTGSNPRNLKQARDTAAFQKALGSDWVPPYLAALAAEKEAARKAAEEEAARVAAEEAKKAAEEEAARKEIHPAQKQYAIAFGALALALVLVLGAYFLSKRGS